MTLELTEGTASVDDVLITHSGCIAAAL